MWWRRAALASNGTAGVRGSWKGPLPYATRSPGATPGDPCNKVAGMPTFSRLALAPAAAGRGRGQQPVAGRPQIAARGLRRRWRGRLALQPAPEGGVEAGRVEAVLGGEVLPGHGGLPVGGVVRRRRVAG